jgi:5-(carboxyamino)imidazole ribonucleotide synthase
MSIDLRASTRLGILGAGQLARMSAYQAFRFGVEVDVYTGTKSGSHSLEPTSLVTPFSVDGLFDDIDAMVEFALNCDVITLENEFIDAEILHHVREASGKPMYPAPETFELIGDKRSEKETFERAGITVTPWALLPSAEDARTFGDTHGYPFVIKSSKGGYDGYGNATVHNADEAAKAWGALGGDARREVIAEAFVDFKMELAVQVARNRTGTVVYPCCESIQEGHICKTVIAPARIEESLRHKAEEMAVAAVEAIDGIGLFAFEFFLTKDDRILLNESAPRPHNSGHYTIEGCTTSQFENHIRAVLGLPLGSTRLRRQSAVMVNLLGKRNHEAVAENTSTLFHTEDAHLHIYGKRVSKIGRKMGHVTVLGDDVETTLNRATWLADHIML